VTFSPDNLTIVSVEKKGTIKIWDVDTGKLLTTCNGCTNGTSNLVFSNLYGQMNPEIVARIKSLRL
jgi:WD40 repeat protein